MNAGSYNQFLQTLTRWPRSFLLDIHPGLTVCQADPSVSWLCREGSMALRGHRGHPTIALVTPVHPPNQPFTLHCADSSSRQLKALLSHSNPLVPCFSVLVVPRHLSLPPPAAPPLPALSSSPLPPTLLSSCSFFPFLLSPVSSPFLLVPFTVLFYRGFVLRI